MTSNEHYKECLKALEATRKKIKNSKKESLKFLIAVGIVDKKGNITPRYKRSYE